jgi:hypothetical protein
MIWLPITGYLVLTIHGDHYAALPLLIMAAMVVSVRLLRGKP